MREGTFDQLYTEAADLLVPYESRLPEQLLNEALRLNRALIKEPFVRSDLEIELSYPIPELYASFQKGENMTPSKGCYRYLIDRSSQHWTDWDTWMREMVWYSGKKSDYLYPLKTRNEGYSV
jgi:hypothetical protein